MHEGRRLLRRSHLQTSEPGAGRVSAGDASPEAVLRRRDGGDPRGDAGLPRVTDLCELDLPMKPPGTVHPPPAMAGTTVS